MRDFKKGDVVIVIPKLRAISATRAFDVREIPAGSKGVIVRIYSSTYLTTIKFLSKGNVCFGTIHKDKII